MEIIKCRNCGTCYKADPDIPAFSPKLLAIGAAIGAVVGAILPGIGIGFGAMMGTKCVVDAMQRCCVCPGCGGFNDVDGS